MSSSLAGTVTLITGASSGIGAELARQCADAGARLALAARDATRLEQVASECRARGAEVVVIPGDVSAQSDCERFVQATVAHYGRLDTLVNNAGIGAGARLDEVTDLSVYDTLMRVNYLGSVWCTAYALPHLKSSRGRVVAIASLTALTGVPKRTAYAATKHAMAGFFDSLRVELMGSGVSVTVIYPGFVVSEINQRALRADGTSGATAGRSPSPLPHTPPPGTMPTSECCRLIVRAMERRDRDCVMTLRGKLGRWLKVISPALVDRIALRVIASRPS